MNVNLEYIKDGINKVKVFTDIDDFGIVEKFIEDNNLVEVKEPENEGECRLTQ